MGLIPQEIIAQVLERSNIVEAISSYIPLKRAGRNFKALCPFHHEKTPSFVVNPDKQIFHCFGCGVGGNAISFVMSQEHLEFPEAVRLLAQKAGVDVPASDGPAAKKIANLKEDIYGVNELAAVFFHQRLVFENEPSVKEAREYLKSRGLSLETVKKFKIGFAPDEWNGLMSFLKKKNGSLGVMEKAGLIIARESRDGFYDRFRNRIVFPIYDVRSHCLGFGARSLKDDGLAKYINSPETPVYRKGNHLYGLHLAKEAIVRHDAVVVVEGYLDFIMPFQAGAEHLVASLGTALTIEQIRLLRRYTQNITMLFDADEAGELATLRNLDSLIEEGMQVTVVSLPKGEDPDSFVRKFGIQTFQEKIGQAQTLFDFKLNLLLSRCPDKTIEARAKIAHEMLQTIHKFENALVRFGYLKQLAKSLSVTEEVLGVELNKISLKTKPNDAPPRPVHPHTMTGAGVKKNGVKMAEYHLLKLLLEENTLIPPTKDEIRLEYFQDEHIRMIVAKVFDLFDRGQTVTVSNLMNCFEDSVILERLSGLMAWDDLIVVDKWKMHRDCLTRLKDDYFKLARQNLRQEIERAESARDHNRLDELKNRFNQLLKRSS